MSANDPIAEVSDGLKTELPTFASFISFLSAGLDAGEDFASYCINADFQDSRCHVGVAELGLVLTSVSCRSGADRWRTRL
jgi:hypothetical protein